jgi:hypothetical protein
MSEALTALLDNASVGNNLTCTLSPVSVQVILFALGFLEMKGVWLQDFSDSVSDAEWEQINDILAQVSQEMLP